VEELGEVLLSINHVKQARKSIIISLHRQIMIIKLFHSQRRLDIAPNIPDSILSLVVLRGADCDDLAAIANPLQLLGLVTQMNWGDHGLRGGSGVKKMHLFVLADHTKHRAISVPLKGPGGLSDAIVAHRALLCLDIPNFDVSVNTRGSDSKVGRWMPLHHLHLFGMALKIRVKVCLIFCETTLGHHPDLDGAISRGCGEHVVQEWVEIKVQYGVLVPRNKWTIHVYLSVLICTEDSDCASTSTFPWELSKIFESCLLTAMNLLFPQIAFPSVLPIGA
jgi:hypothetical protein